MLHINYARARGMDGGDVPEVRIARNSMNRRDHNLPTLARPFFFRALRPLNVF